MCTELCFGTDSEDVPVIFNDSSGLWTQQVATPTAWIQKIFGTQRLFELGSYMGCSCGLMTGEGLTEGEQTDDPTQRVANVQALGKYLTRYYPAISEILTLYSYELYDACSIPHRSAFACRFTRGTVCV